MVSIIFLKTTNFEKTDNTTNSEKSKRSIIVIKQTNIINVKQTILNYFQVFLWLFLWALANGFEWTCPSEEQELTLCSLISNTPNYINFKLHEKGNCLAHVKVFENVACLRNDNNQVLL